MFTDLKFKVVNKGKNRVVLEDYSYQNDKYKITALPGFNTNGASIPKFFWSALSSPYYGALVYAATLHDALYTKEALPRKECDKLLREMALKKGYNPTKANLVYVAVRLFGWSHWKKNTDAQKHLVKIERIKNV